MPLVFAIRSPSLTVLAVLGIALIPAEAQLLTSSAGKSVNFEPGSTAHRLVLAVTEPPAPGDRIEMRLTTQKVDIDMVTPDGRRINAHNSKEIGFEWFDEVDLVPLGEDTAHIVRVVFARPDLAGNYALEFVAPDLKQTARADVRFVSRLAEYAEKVRSARGLQIRAARIHGFADIPINVSSDFAKDANAWFEIALSAPADKLTLKLPIGRILDIGPGDHAEYSLRTFEEHYPKRVEEDFTSLWDIPMDGTHYLIQLSNTSKGRYAVHVESHSKAIVVVRFGTFEGLAKAIGKQFTEQPELLQPRPGKVKLGVQTLPFNCYAGDTLAVVAKLPGNIGSKTPEFTARIQNQPLLASTDIGMRYGDPGPVETQPLAMAHEADGTWHGAVTIKNAGMARVSLRVSGETAQGIPFTEEILLTNSTMIVYPIVARLVSLTALPVDEDGDGKFDRLDVTAELDVSYPGTYQMGCTFTSGGHTFRVYAAKSSPNRLARGRRTLTLSFRSQSLWNQLRYGPLVVGDVSLLYEDGGYLVKVPNMNVQAQTEPLKREQWYPGRVFGDDDVTVHGIQPASSGRFRFAEVQWGVTTSGGQCAWNGMLRNAGNMLFPGVRYEGSLPPGRTILSFIFDADPIANGKAGWSIGAGIQCGRDDARLDSASLAIDPGQYQPAQESFSIELTNPTRIVTGGSASVSLGVRSARERVSFRLGNIPAGLTARLGLPIRRTDYVEDHVTVQVAADTRPGRYGIEIAVDSETETVRTELLVDVVSK